MGWNQDLGFLDGCRQNFVILTPFLGTLVTANIRPEKTSFLMSPKEIYLVQLIADLQPIFANKHCTKMKFSIKYFFSKCDQICRKLWVWSHLLKKSLMENFIFCAVFTFVACFLLSRKKDKKYKNLSKP